MEKYPQPFDICIVCALYEEAEAVLDEFSKRCSVSFTKGFSSMDRYAYQHTTVQNKQGEPLTVLVTWLSGSGPSQTGLDLKPFLHEFRPRFVAMTGICAGDKSKVKLGDLVVAEYAYHYEEGKIIRELDGQSRHLPEMKTADPTSQIIQYARGFDGWKEPLRELKATEEARCFVAPMASGMAVRGDDPFLWLRENYNRNTIALDMEAATFYRALSAVPHIHALVVKGVCDYADMNKNDAYHDYAARASAVYLLSFIQEYVTEQTMPRWNAPSPSIRVGPPGVWNVLHTLNTLLIKQTRLAIFMNRLNMALGLAALMAVLVAIGLDKIAPDRLTFTNTLGNAAYLTSLVIYFSELYVLAVYRQWLWWVGLLVVGAGVYLSNGILVFGGYMIYFVAAIVPLVFSVVSFFTSRKTIAMKP